MEHPTLKTVHIIKNFYDDGWTMKVYNGAYMKSYNIAGPLNREILGEAADIIERTIGE